MRRFARAAGANLDIATARRAISVAGVALFCISCVLVLSSMGASATTDFTSFQAPLTGANDFATNFPTEPFGLTFIGPLGLLDDGTSYFISDYANNTLYKFPLSGGDASTVKSAVDGLEDMAIDEGTYFATMTHKAEVVTWDPTTLAVGPTTIPLPCLGLGLSGDPVTGNLLVSTTCGVYRVKNPLSSLPVVKRFSKSHDGFDGNAFSADGQTFWAADDSANQVVQFDRRGRVLTTIPDSHHPDGIVFSQPDTSIGGTDVSSNVFVNNNDGTIVRIDTNNNDQMSVVASGGTRGDFAIAGADGCFYATQSDRVERVEPCFFSSTGPTTTTTDAPTTTQPAPTTTVPPTTTAPPTTAPRATTTSAPPATTAPPTTAPPTTAPPVVAASSSALAFTGVGTGIKWMAVLGFALGILGLLMLGFAESPWSKRTLEWFLGRM